MNASAFASINPKQDLSRPFFPSAFCTKKFSLIELSNPTPTTNHALLPFFFTANYDLRPDKTLTAEKEVLIDFMFALHCDNFLPRECFIELMIGGFSDCRNVIFPPINFSRPLNSIEFSYPARLHFKKKALGTICISEMRSRLNFV